MQNFSQATAATSTALNSTGSAMQENSRHMESLEAKTNQLKATFQELANNVIDNELIKSLLSFANGALKVADTSIGRFIIQTTLLTGALGGLGSLLSFYVPALTQFGTAFKTLGTIISGTSTAALTFGTVLKTVFPIATVVSTVLVGLYTGVKLLKNAFADTTPTMSDTVVSLKENLATTTETITKVDDLINSYKELASKEQKSAEDKFKLAGIQSQLNEAIGIYGGEIDLTSGSIEENTKKIKENTLAYLNNQLVVNADKYKTAKQWQPDYTLGGSTTKEEQDIEQKILIKYPTEAAKWSTELFKQFLTELYAALPDVNSAFGKEVTEAFKSIEQGAFEAEQAMSEYESVLTEVAQNTSLEDFLNKAVMGYGMTKDEAIDFYKSVVEGSQNATTGNGMYFQSLEQLSIAIKEQNAEIDNAQSAFKILSSAQEEYNANNSLSIDTVQELLSLDANYINALIDENGQLNLNSNTIKNLIKDKNAHITALAAEALGTYVTTRAQELLEQQNKKVGDTAEQVAPTLNELGNAALISGTKALEGSTYWNAYWEGVRGAGQNIGLDQSSTEQLIGDAKKFASNLQTVLNSTSTKITGWAGSATKSKAKSATKTATDILEGFKKQLEIVDHEMFLLEKKNTEEADKQRIQLAIATEKKINAEAQRLRKLGYSEQSKEIRELQKLWWGYSDTISEIQDKISERNKKAFEDRLSISEDYVSKRNDLNDWGADSEIDAWKRVLSWMETDYYNKGLIDYETYTEKRAEIAKKLADAEKEALQKQVSDYETAFSYVASKAQDEIDELQKHREERTQYWQDQIDAIQKQNDELNEQIQLEQALEALAKAKATKTMVFKDGRFQYAEDVDAVSGAQASLDAIKREQALKEEVKNLEALRDEELASIDAQIEGWEDYRDAWRNVVEDYQSNQEKLIAEQILGAKLEGENWKDRLKDLSSYVKEYNDLMGQLKTGYGSGSSGGGSYRQVDSSGKAPSGSQIGDYIVTGGGTFLITGGTPDNWTSEKVSNSTTMPKHANGTMSATGGLSLVGEQGAEMRVLNQGDGILPAGITKNLWGWGSINPKNFLGQMNGGLSFNNVNMSFPSVRNGADAESFVTGLKNLAYQRAFQRT